MLKPDEILSFSVFLICVYLCVFVCGFKDLLKTSRSFTSPLLNEEKRKTWISDLKTSQLTICSRSDMQPYIAVETCRLYVCRPQPSAWLPVHQYHSKQHAIYRPAHPGERHLFNISVQSPELKNTCRELLLFHKYGLLIWQAVMFEFKMNPSIYLTCLLIENAIIKDTVAQAGKKIVFLCIIIILLEKMLSNPLDIRILPPIVTTACLTYLSWIFMNSYISCIPMVLNSS